jgi:hypothetical protein
MGIQRFTSVRTAPKFFGSNVRGIFLGGVGVVVVVVVGLVVTVVGFVVGVSVVGVAESSVPAHPDARVHRRTPAPIDLTIKESPTMRTMLAAGNERSLRDASP